MAHHPGMKQFHPHTIQEEVTIEDDPYQQHVSPITDEKESSQQEDDDDSSPQI
jgi:hypothetical protein